MKKYLLIFAVFWMCVPFAAQAAITERLGDFGKWSAFKSLEKGQSVCFISSQPTKTEGKYSRRGEILVFVSHRPKEGVIGEVSFLSGYDFKPANDDDPLAGQIEAKIGEEKMYLFTQGERAWAKNETDDKKLVQSMISGEKMLVRGRSKYDTLTTDTYSLAGFTKAYEKITSVCKI